MKNATGSAMLRTMLRNVNIEYSTVVRDAGGTSKAARLSELRTRRLALMARIAGLGSSVRVDRQKQAPILVGAGVELFPRHDMHSGPPLR